MYAPVRLGCANWNALHRFFTRVPIQQQLYHNSVVNRRKGICILTRAFRYLCRLSRAVPMKEGWRTGCLARLDQHRYCLELTSFYRQRSIAVLSPSLEKPVLSHLFEIVTGDPKLRDRIWQFMPATDLPACEPLPPTPCSPITGSVHGYFTCH